MALIKCPECGREKVSDTAEACPDCGYAVKKHFEQIKYEEEQKLIREKAAREEAEKQKRKAAELQLELERKRIAREEAEEQKRKSEERREAVKKKLGIGVCIAVVACTLILGLKEVAIPSLQYARAERLFEQKKYENAEAIFKKLGSYEDSKSKAVESQLKKIEERLKEGKELDKLLEELNSMEASDEVLAVKNDCLMQLSQNEYGRQEYNKALNYLNKMESTKESESLKSSCLWNLASREHNAGSYEQAISYWNEMSDFNLLGEAKEEAMEMFQNDLLQFGISLYDSGEFNLALSCFRNIENKDDAVNQYINNADLLDQLQGKWYSDERKEGYEIDGWEMESKRFDSNRKIKDTSDYDIKSMTISGTEIINNISTSSIHFELEGRTLKISYLYPGKENDVLQSTHYYFMKTEAFPTPKAAPRIGMTAEQVRDSTWGSPNKINKSTNAWGTSEQWCYSGYRYIYFEDGVVTSISE